MAMERFGQTDMDGWIFTMEKMAASSGDARDDRERKKLKDNGQYTIDFEIGNRVRIES